MSRPRFITLLLALLTLVIYLPVRQNDFVVYDDNDYLTENLVVQNGLTSAGIKWAFTSWHASNWHPLTWLSHMLDCELFGLNAGAHHLMNVLIHAINVALLLTLLRRLTGRLWPAALVAALFAWHPLHVESVAWASERKDVLSAGFALLTLLAYTSYVEKTHVPTAAARSAYGFALLCFTLGLLAKPMLVTLPFVMLLLDWWPLQRRTGATAPPATRLVWEKIPFFLLSVASCVVTFLAQRAAAVLTVAQHPLPLRLSNALVSYVQYIWKTIWPIDLAIPYPLTASHPIGFVVIAAGILALLSGLAWHHRRSYPYLFTGWFWFLGMLVPVIGLVQVGRQAMADRYTYLPHIGLFIGLVYELSTLAQRWRIKPLFLSCGASLVLVACIVSTEYQLRFWRDSETLFTRTLAVTQNNAIAHINLGVALQLKNQRADALEHFRAAVRIDPQYLQAHNNLAILLDALDRNDEALAEYQAALRIDPNQPHAHCNFGTLLVKLGRFEEAFRHYTEAARLAPDDPHPHYLQGKAELRRGQNAAAIIHFREALRRHPDELRSLTFLAQILATAPDAGIRNGLEAVTLAERAKALTSGSDAFVLDTLAMAYAEVGRFPEAQQSVQTALELLKAAGEAPPPELLQRQQLYRINRPFHESFPNQPAGAP